MQTATANGDLAASYGDLAANGDLDSKPANNKNCWIIIGVVGLLLLPGTNVGPHCS